MQKPWLTAVIVALALGFLSFLNGFGGEYVLDDQAFLVDNLHLVTPHTLAYFFTENLWYYSNLQDVYSASYRPLFFLILWLSNHLNIANPFALHVFSFLLHMLATLLLIFTIRRLIPGISPMATGMAASLFAVHPVHTEAIAWIAAFVHPLVTIFLLAAYLIHERYPPETGRKTAIFVAAIFFALALLTNEMATAFPFFILLNDRIKYGHIYILKNLPYFALLIIYVLIRGLVLGESLPLTFSDPEMWFRIPVFLLEYLRQLWLPWPQPLYLQMPEGWGLSAGALITVAIMIAVWAWVRRNPTANRIAPIIAIAWTAAFLLPPIAAAFSPDARFALRSLYLPSAGLAMLLAWVLDTQSLFRRPLVITFTFALILLAMGGTIVANRQWVNDGEVYGKVVFWNPTHYAGYLGLGRFYERRGDVDQALNQYQESVVRAKLAEKVEPLKRIARLLGETGNNTQSLEVFKQIIELEPKSAFAWTGLGNNLWALGRLQAAVDAYRQAHKLQPDYRIACSNLVLVLNQLGNFKEATRYADCSREVH